jgi:hypothetical protein
MAAKTPIRAAALTLTLLLLATAPAAHAARRDRTPASRPRAEAGALDWLTHAWQWLTSTWEHAGSEIDPNGTPTPRPSPPPPGITNEPPAPDPATDETTTASGQDAEILSAG